MDEPLVREDKILNRPRGYLPGKVEKNQAPCRPDGRQSSRLREKSSVNLWDAGAERLVERGGPADSLWRLLEKQDGAGWVTAGKLLARKRPSLIPVYDNVVRCAFGWPQNFWTALRDALRQEHGRFLATLNDLKQRPELPCQVTSLRILDVAVWMRHQPLRTGHRSNGLT